MNSPEKVNLVADKISFVNKISILLKATSDDEKAIPGYVYKEVSAISHETVGYCESLVEYLVDRLEKDSYHVKLKVLKIMRYTLDHGHPNFKLGLMKMSHGVRAATKYGGLPDPLHGNIPYIMVRKEAQELCQVLFDVEETAVDKPSDAAAKQPSKIYDGFGMTNSMKSPGKMEGFGNTPQNQQKSLGDTIIDGITKIAEKMSETESDRQRAVLASLDTGSGHYRPPLIASPDTEMPLVDTSQTVLSPAATRAPPKHIPGRAGGGWEDEPITPQKSSGSGREHTGSGGGSDLADRLESVTVEDWKLEEQLVTTTVEDKSCLLLAPSQMTAFHRKCAAMNSEKVLEFIIQRLSSDQEDVVMKCLLLLETFLRSDVVNLEHLVTFSEHSLVSVHNHWIGPPRSKARKIIRILEKLTSHTDILGTSDKPIISDASSPTEIHLEGGEKGEDLLKTIENLGIAQDNLIDTNEDLT